VGAALDEAGISGAARIQTLREYQARRVWPTAAAAVFDSLRSADSDLAAAYLPERFLMATAALESLDRLPASRVCEDVQTRMCTEFRFFAEPQEDWIQTFETGSRTSIAYAELALLQRFTAGQLHWIVSGLPRS
jgi:hypothetical protein